MYYIWQRSRYKNITHNVWKKPFADKTREGLFIWYDPLVNAVKAAVLFYHFYGTVPVVFEKIGGGPVYHLAADDYRYGGRAGD